MENKNFYGMIIGIAQYQNIKPLPATIIKDANDIYNVLTDPDCGSYPAENVQLITDQQATREGILQAFDQLSKQCDAESSAFIYISSHGGQIESGPFLGEYLLPVETNAKTEQQLASSAISGEQFTECLQSIHARKLVVIFDCCHSGGIGQPKDPSEPVFKSGFSDQYYDWLKVGRGRVIFASSSSDELSWIMSGSTNSLFTGHLLQGLKGGAAGPDGLVRIFDLYDFIQPKVVSEQPKQHPVFKAEVEENFPIAFYKSSATNISISKLNQTVNDDFVYDAFISYRQKEPDKSWVRKKLLPALEAYGMKVCIDFRDFQLGEYLIHEMERAVEKSRCTVAILTPAYITSNFTDLENVLAEHLGVETGQRKLIIILREECKPRIGLRSRLWLDMADDDEFEINIHRLVKEINQLI
jgi:hypothetical protein